MIVERHSLESLKPCPFGLPNGGPCELATKVEHGVTFVVCKAYHTHWLNVAEWNRRASLSGETPSDAIRSLADDMDKWADDFKDGLPGRPAVMAVQRDRFASWVARLRSLPPTTKDG